MTKVLKEFIMLLNLWRDNMFGKKIDQWLSDATIKMLRKQAKLQRYEIEVEERRIVYLENERQEKKTLILIHGSNDEKDSWLMLASALKEDYHLIIIDLLGCGESELVEDFDYSLASQALFLQKVIEQILQEKNIESFALAGHSMGGLVVFLTNKLPIEKFILIDTMGLHTTTTKMELEFEHTAIDDLPFLNLSNRKELKALMPQVYWKVPYIPNFILDTMVEKKRLINAFEKKKFKAIVSEKMRPIDDLTEVFQSIKQETLIVWGKEDLGIDVSSAYGMNELIEHSTLKIYDECRHYPQLEKPKELARDIIEFLK